MPIPQIPASLLKNPDRNAAFRDLRSWMQNELHSAPTAIEHSIPTGSLNIDSALQGGYIPGHITEIVEPSPSRGVQSLIHFALSRARRELQYVALIDASNQFDPQSESTAHLQSMLWVRITRIHDLMKACDILIRDGNFPLLLLDLRNISVGRKHHIRPNDWYRLQRVCEQSRVAFVAFTKASTIPCAHSRLQLGKALSIDLLDHPQASAVNHIECEILKHRTSNLSWQTSSDVSAHQGAQELKVVNLR